MFEKDIPYLRSTRKRDDNVLSLIEYNIVKMNIKPGEMISETEICKEIGCSRSPVRSAFLILSYKNLLEIIPQRGTRVRFLEEDLITSICLLRRALEMDNLQMLAHLKTDYDIATRLRVCLEIQDDAAFRKDYWTLFEIDNEIHELLFVATGRLGSYRIIQDQMVNFNRLRMLIYKDRDLDRIISEHKELVASYVTGDIENISNILGHHVSIELITDDMSAIKEKYPEYFI